MSAPEKPDIPGWFGLRRPWVLTVARPLGPILSGVVFLLFALAVTAAAAILLHAIFDLGLGTPRTGFGTGAVIVALLGAPFVIWRAVVAQKTVSVQEQGQITDRINTAVEGLGAEKEVSRIGRPVLLQETDPNPFDVQFIINEEKHTVIEWQGEPLRIPDGMHVGNEGDWQVFTETQPNLEVRIGAIYALERIAQDSDRDHVQIMEILCAYIRQNAPAPAEDDWPELEMRESEDDGPLEADWEERLEAFREAQEKAMAGLKVREDIQVTLEVIGRRSENQRQLEARAGDAPDDAEFVFDADYPEYGGPDEAHDPEALESFNAAERKWQKAAWGYEGYRLDLRGADLRGANLSRLNLNGAKLDDTHLQGAKLWQARLQGAGLVAARLQGAGLVAARLQGADLEAARLQGADLVEARLQGAHFGEARFQGAHLFRARLQGAVLMETRLQGAVLMEARLQGALLGEARLQGADLLATRLQGANLAHARLQGAGPVGAQLQGAFLGEARFDPETDLAAATLRGAAARSADYTSIAQIADHLEGMFGDGAVRLPEGMARPSHWPAHELSNEEFREEWRKWRDDPDNYDPPEAAGG